MKLPDNFNYQDAKKELSEILEWFETSDIDVDTALEKYDRANELLQNIETYLNDAKAKIKIKIEKNKA